jgi:hypothetical protein
LSNSSSHALERRQSKEGFTLKRGLNSVTEKCPCVIAVTIAKPKKGKKLNLQRKLLIATHLDSMCYSTGFLVPLKVQISHGEDGGESGDTDVTVSA